ncbi:hypothetical protein VE23_18900 [Paenibacillus sp. D9]|nr:hypothetical protein VE23_18900 [Paenibacillus sp. D9]
MESGLSPGLLSLRVNADPCSASFPLGPDRLDFSRGTLGNLNCAMEFRPLYQQAAGEASAFLAGTFLQEETSYGWTVRDRTDVMMVGPDES